MSYSRIRQLKSAPTLPCAWSWWQRALILLLAVVQLVAPTWHVCAMSGNTHAECDSHNTTRDVSRFAEVVDVQVPHPQVPHPQVPHADDDADAPPLICDLKEHSANNEYSFQGASHNVQSHNVQSRALVHSVSHASSNKAKKQCPAHRAVRCCTGDDSDDANTSSRSALRSVESPHEMTCLAMLLTTMPSSVAASLTLPTFVATTVAFPATFVVSRSAMPLALCDARAPPVFRF